MGVDIQPTTVVTYGVLGLAASVSFLLPDYLSIPTVSAQSVSEIRLLGTVRDFRAAHSDFDVGSSSVFGHYAGNVTTTLPASGEPAYVAGGYKVAVEWTDVGARPIAPHLSIDQTDWPVATMILVDGPVSISQGEIRSFDSTDGTYGLANVGEQAMIITNSTDPGSVQITNNAEIGGRLVIGTGGDPDQVVDVIGNSSISGGIATLSAPFVLPPIVWPSGLGASTGDLVMNNGTINSDLHVDHLEIRQNAVVWIDGDITIACEYGLELRNRSSIALLPGASLRLYIDGALELGNLSAINENTADPDFVQLFVVGSGTIDIENNADLYANVLAPDATLHLTNSGAIGGGIAVGELIIDNSAFLYTDAAGLCNLPPLDTPGVQGVAGDGGITSASSFTQWFANAIGTNLSINHTITLVSSGGVYEFLDDAFSPIDGRLFGNEGQVRNEFFTYDFTASFTYAECGGQFVEFDGGDGMWLYIDDELVIDLGGISTPVGGQFVELDRLNLVGGEQYTFKLFYAERTAGAATFRLRTNIELSQPLPLVSVTAGFD